jgi:ubiquinone/menaquinone biosynthesis C-methylase UbiE/uncharacterized protein YbaR (Trm112 family)
VLVLVLVIETDRGRRTEDRNGFARTPNTLPMNESLLQWLRCPSGCEGPLGLHVERLVDGDIYSGALCCAGCSRVYPIEEGIPRMLPQELSAPPNSPSEGEGVEATTRKLSEMQARDAQVEEYDRMWYLNLFGLVEVPAMLLNLSLASDHLLLEAGCGTGRMTRQFAGRCRRLISVDFSWESLRVCAAKLRRAGVRNVDLVQADICHLPLKTDAFDRVVSCQVLEHIPTPESRSAAVGDLARVLRPDGNLAISAYQYSLLMRLFGEKEGEHAGGIYFYRFDREELHTLLGRHFRVEGMTGALVYHYIARCRKGREGRWIRDSG